MGIVSKEQEKINYLETELQQQRGMLWLLGEMMKAANDISVFHELMATLTDMLMGVMGVTTCYLWIKIGNMDIDDYTIFYRSIELHNSFNEKKHSSVPAQLKEITESTVFSKDHIKQSLLEKIGIPSSRLAVPMNNFENGEMFGILVVEHEKEHFFSNNMVAFFETLSVFIATRAINSKKIAQIAEQSIKDPLTGSYNRRYLSVAMEKMKKSFDAVTVAVVDTDNFKTINDELGHMEGDIVLKGIAQLAQGLAKECNGNVIRYGGDEFVILVPRGKEEALSILESFCMGVRYLKIAYNIKANVSVTLGVCCYPDMIDDCGEALIRAADNALLRGKAKGKNRIVLAEAEDMA